MSNNYLISMVVSILDILGLSILRWNQFIQLEVNEKCISKLTAFWEVSVQYLVYFKYFPRVDG